MKVYCAFSLESLQRGDSNEYTQYTISQHEKENHPKLSQICSYGICSQAPKNEFETAVVKKPSVFEPLKFNYIIIIIIISSSSSSLMFIKKNFSLCLSNKNIFSHFKERFKKCGCKSEIKE